MWLLQEPQLPPLTQFLPAQTPNPDLPTPANNQALGIPCTSSPSLVLRINYEHLFASKHESGLLPEYMDCN